MTTRGTSGPDPAGLREAGAVFVLAVQFLTRIPVRADGLYSPARMAAVPRFFPAVGVLVGALVAAVFWLAALALPQLLAAILATAFSLRLTGAFHEDGFADACDGLGGGMTRERMLEIMRDSRLGTYGAAGLGLMLAAKVAVLASLPLALVPVVLVAGHALSRGSAVLAMAGGRYMRLDGAGRYVQEAMDRSGWVWWGGSLALVLVLALAGLPVGAVLTGLAGLALGHVVMRRIYEPRLGGYTGDCLGAVQQCSEIGFLIGVLAWL